MADQGCVWLLAAGQVLGARAKPTAYRLYACSVCDINSVLDIVSGRYAKQIHLLTNLVIRMWKTN